MFQQKLVSTLLTRDLVPFSTILFSICRNWDEIPYGWIDNCKDDLFQSLTISGKVVLFFAASLVPGLTSLYRVKAPGYEIIQLPCNIVNEE